MKRKHKLCLTLLTHHRLDKLKRLVKSVDNLIPHESIEISDLYIVVNTLDEDYHREVMDEFFGGYTFIRTESNGKPGKGNNSCRDLFLKTDADYLCQLDGDHWLYPTFLISIAEHLEHYPDLDVLGQYPCDIITPYENTVGHRFTVGDKDQYHGAVWGTSMIKMSDHGPGKGHWVDHNHPTNFDRLILQSKRSAQFRMDEDLPNGEDHLYCVQLLKEHQERRLRYFITLSSDLYVCDSTVDNSIQKEFPFYKYVDEMKNKMFKYVDVNRSSQQELPVIFKPLHLTQEQKEVYIKETF